MIKKYSTTTKVSKAQYAMIDAAKSKGYSTTELVNLGFAHRDLIGEVSTKEPQFIPVSFSFDYTNAPVYKECGYARLLLVGSWIASEDDYPEKPKTEKKSKPKKTEEQKFEDKKNRLITQAAGELFVAKKKFDDEAYKALFIETVKDICGNLENPELYDEIEASINEYLA